MARRETHIEKYRMFKGDAENEDVSPPSRVEAYFSAAFHLIEACAAGHNVHIQKHKSLRRVLEDNPGLFGEDTESIWKCFQKIENQIRPGQMYGGKIDGEALRRAKELFEEIERICLERI
jgi:hypothetical protein